MLDVPARRDLVLSTSVAPARAKPAIETAQKLIPSAHGLTLPKLREAAASCAACHLHLLGTQTVFGEGARHAKLMLVGEQPGDHEDLEGRPFVGPAGKLLDRALEAAGIDRADAYVTNVVKHFKWEPRGKRRIHQKPNVAEITACRPWLDAELSVVHPRALMCLGATAAQALLGKSFKVTQHRGEILSSELASTLAPIVLATVHPSSLLRAPDPETRARETARFLDDFVIVARKLAANA